MAGTPRVCIALLRNVPLLSLLSEYDLALLARVVSRKSYARGSLILAAGDLTDSLYILISGRIKVFMNGLDGKEVFLSILGPNEFFGEMALIDGSPRSANVVALEPCELVCIPKPYFKRCPADNFDMAMTVMRRLLKHLREMVSRVMKHLQEAGYIEVHADRIVIRDNILPLDWREFLFLAVAGMLRCHTGRAGKMAR